MIPTMYLSFMVSYHPLNLPAIEEVPRFQSSQPGRETYWLPDLEERVAAHSQVAVLVTAPASSRPAQVPVPTEPLYTSTTMATAEHVEVSVSNPKPRPRFPRTQNVRPHDLLRSPNVGRGFFYHHLS